MFAYTRIWDGVHFQGSRHPSFLPSLPSLSLSRLCGLELGIHVTANGPHDVDRVPDANLSAVLGRDLRQGKGGEGGGEDITFGFSPLSLRHGKIR